MSRIWRLWQTGTKASLKIKVYSINVQCLPLLYRAGNLIRKRAVRLMRHDFPFLNRCWLLSVAFLPVMCLEMELNPLKAITLPRTKVRLIMDLTIN